MGVIRLVWPPGTIGSNSRLHPIPKARIVKKHRAWAKVAALGAMPIDVPADGPIPIHFEFHPPNRRKLDDDNALSRVKAARDGIADALGIDDNRFRTTFTMGEPDFNGIGYVLARIG